MHGKWTVLYCVLVVTKVQFRCLSMSSEYAISPNNIDEHDCSEHQKRTKMNLIRTVSRILKPIVAILAIFMLLQCPRMTLFDHCSISTAILRMQRCNF